MSHAAPAGRVLPGGLRSAGAVLGRGCVTGIRAALLPVLLQGGRPRLLVLAGAAILGWGGGHPVMPRAEGPREATTVLGGGGDGSVFNPPPPELCAANV